MALRWVVARSVYTIRKEQARVLEILGEETQEMNHLLEALSHGAPPHGGFALGLDRYVALLVGEGDPSVPVIAFPKSKDGRDLLCKAPTSPSRDQLERYGISFKEDLNDNKSVRKC
ncbi:hypothetical protein COOONC_14449 [Cooperia oncophora]